MVHMYRLADFRWINVHVDMQPPSLCGWESLRLTTISTINLLLLETNLNPLDNSGYLKLVIHLLL